MVSSPPFPVGGGPLTADSAFSIGGVRFDLSQILSPLFIGGVRSGSLLTQRYALTNITKQTIDFDIVRFMDGDLHFVGSFSDDGGGRRVIDGTEILFETDEVANAANIATFVGITADGGTHPTVNRYEIDAYTQQNGLNGLATRIVNGGILDDLVAGDVNGDQFIDNRYDVTLALRNEYGILAETGDNYVTRTIWGSISPDSLELPAIIVGEVWDDQNSNGVREATEPAQTNWTVYTDDNNNGQLDAGENSVQTDTNGQYIFADLVPGNYNIALVRQTGWEQTVPVNDQPHRVTVMAGDFVDEIDFGTRIRKASIAGVKWYDVNGNGTRDAGDLGEPGFQIYLDSNGNGQLDSGERAIVTDRFGKYEFKELDAGTYTVREVAKANWVQTTPAGAHTVTVAFGDEVTGRDFGNQFQGGLVQGVKWGDYNGNGAQESSEIVMGGWTIFADADGNGQLDPGEMSQITADDGSYSMRLVAGSYTILEVQQSNWRQTSPAAGHNVTVAVGQTIPGRNFGNDPDPGEIHGTKWWDQNENGRRDGNDPGFDGFVIYIDENGDGVRNAGEQFDTSAADGSYTLRFLDPGTYTVREETRTGWAQTYPGGGGGHSVTITAGRIVTGVDFGNRALPGSISGVKYHDLNTNGVRDFGEPGQPGFVIYLDENGDDVIGLGEPQVRTDSSGNYLLEPVPPGVHSVREVFQPGWLPVAPPDSEQTATVSAGQNVENINFGSMPSIDYGDAPAPYLTRAADGGPSHGIIPGFHLGTGIDGETDGTPEPAAMGDDNTGADEDGVRFVSSLVRGRSVTMEVDASRGSAYLQVWVDFNGDGDFADSDEQIVQDEMLAPGTTSFSVAIPASASVGQTILRARYGFEQGLGPNGVSFAGEVEDHAISIVAPIPILMLGDLDGDGKVGVPDLLRIRASFAGSSGSSSLRTVVAQWIEEFGMSQVPGASPSAAPAPASAVDLALVDDVLDEDASRDDGGTLSSRTVRRARHRAAAAIRPRSVETPRFSEESTSLDRQLDARRARRSRSIRFRAAADELLFGDTQ